MISITLLFFLTISQVITVFSIFQCPSDKFECVTVSTCNVLRNVIKYPWCLDQTQTCGYVGLEPMICCPIEQGPIYHAYPQWNPPPDNSAEKLTCGSSRVKDTIGFNGLGAQPWIVRIGFTNTEGGESKYPCGGSLISPRAVLTAAHCALAKFDNYKLQTVQIGEWDTEANPDCGSDFCSLPTQEININHVLVYPYYEAENYLHDVAIVYLQTPANLTVTSQSICIFSKFKTPLYNYGTLVGWGKLAGQEAQPSRQQSLTLALRPIEICKNVYKDTNVKLGSEDQQFCVGGNTEGQDACAGFGGYPLIVKHSNGVFIQIGILSFGSEQCGIEGIPSVYTSIRYYADWIRENAQLSY